MLDTTSTALTALMFGELLAPENDTHLLTASVRRAVEKDTPGLRLADWTADGGPDGEQFACAVDLVRARLEADPALAARCDRVARTDGPAALTTLAARLDEAGHEGAARSCREALQNLVPGRTSLTTVTDRSRTA